MCMEGFAGSLGNLILFTSSGSSLVSTRLVGLSPYLRKSDRSPEGHPGFPAVCSQIFIFGKVIELAKILYSAVFLGDRRPVPLQHVSGSWVSFIITSSGGSTGAATL